MSDTATAPVATVTLPSGAVVTSAMTPLERHNAVAASLNLPTAAKPSGITFGPGGLTPATANRLAAGEREHGGTAAPGSIAGKAPPPSAAALERSNAMPPQGNPSLARQAEFEAEMQAKGLMVRPDGRTIAAGQVDEEAINLLTATYRTLALANRDNPAAAARFKVAYENDLKSLLDGKQLSGAQIAELRKRAGGGNVESFVPKSKEPAPQAPPAVPGWQSHIEDLQWVGLEHLTTADTSGYTIPNFIDGQRVHTSTFELLKQAKAAGISQAQIDTVLTQHAVRAGWVKA